MRARIEAELAGRLSEGEPSAPNLYGFPTVEDCDGERRSLILRYRTYSWMENHLHILHGGVIAMVMDNSMGLAALGLCGRITPTISMTLSYCRPVLSGPDILAEVRVVALDGATAQATARLYQEGGQDSLVLASGVYYVGEKRPAVK